MEILERLGGRMMQKFNRFTVVGPILILTVLLVVIAGTLFQNRPVAQASIQTLTVSSSGAPMKTLFDGEKSDTHYSIKDILGRRSKLPQCGDKKKEREKQTEPGLVQRVFGNSVVYAGCPFGDCGGTGWINFENNCNTGGPCSGNYNDTTTDPLSNQGFFYPHYFCGHSSACGCVTIAC